MNKIERFCDKHDACPEGRKWALESCLTPQEVWAKARADWLIWAATRQGVLSDRELRLFAVFCARQVEHLTTDDRSRNAIAVAERFANGEASVEELAAAHAAARDAAWGARAAAWAAAQTAADVAWLAAEAAARAAADTAEAAVRTAVRDAAWAADSERAAQAAWLRENTRPNFEVHAR